MNTGWPKVVRPTFDTANCFTSIRDEKKARGFHFVCNYDIFYRILPIVLTADRFKADISRVDARNRGRSIFFGSLFYRDVEIDEISVFVYRFVFISLSSGLLS